MMKSLLAIITPRIGAYSETFIRRHIEDLLPGETAAIAYYRLPKDQCFWDINTPSLMLDERMALKENVVSAEAVRRVHNFLDLNGVEVILAEYLDWGVPLLDACKDKGVKYYAHAHGYDVSKRLKDAEWRERYGRYNFADGVITMSEVSKHALIKLGLKHDKIHVVRHGIDIPGPQQKSPRVNGTIKCLSVGRLVPKKAPLLTLEAFRLASLLYPELTLEMVGTGSLKEQVQYFIEEHHLQDRVSLYGSQKHDVVLKLMKQADIFIQHSIVDHQGNQEGLPAAIMEAMAFGVPVVSTIHAGIPEAVIDGKTGFLVEEKDVIGMAHRLVLLAENTDLRLSLGEKGYRRAKRLFSWNKQRSKLLEALGLKTTH